MASPQDPLPPEVLAAFQRNQPIQAIKLLLAGRAQTKPSPKPVAAKPPARAVTSHTKSSAVPSLESIMSGRALSPGEVPRSGSSIWAWVVVALLVYLAYRLILG